MANGKKKIVIVGGGMSGLAAAFGLTSAPNWRDSYDITVLQLGWRLGGKGASGRNPNAEQRIEEHGLHVWGGFYENAFRVMRACYQELNRPPTAPLATWDEAFKPSPLVSWMEDLAGTWLAWNNSFPQYSNSTPGDGTPMPSLLEGMLRILEWVIQTALDSGIVAQASKATQAAAAARARANATPAWVQKLEANAAAAFAGGIRLDNRTLHTLIQNRSHPPEVAPLVSAYKILRAAGPDPKSHAAPIHNAVVWLLNAFRSNIRAIGSEPSDSNGLRRARILIDLGVTETIGMLVDGVLIFGFNVIDNEDLMAWYTRHGAAPDSVNSAVVRGGYDFIFAYMNGDPTRPALGAGAGLRCILRLIMWYKGAIFWKMQAGMGDTVFAPLYLVLQNRGVAFKFFQKVENLGLSQDGTTIATIQVGEQATLVGSNYQPLYPVNDLPCWPNAPFFDQLVQGQELKALGIDLEDPWANWQPVNAYTMNVGTDFDEIILATSLAPLKEICSELISASPAWTNMAQYVQTVQTQAFQLWMTPALADLGWTAGSTVLTAYGHPFETWADMSQVIPREAWPPGEAPQSIAYMCGPLIDADPIPPYSDHAFPAQQAALVQQNSLNWIAQYLTTIWPSGKSGGGFNWALVDDPSGASGPARFNSQYWRANLSPAERYVLSVPGSTQYRLSPANSGFTNFYLAGDWTLNGLNFGCIESATMGGLEVSQAICGYPHEIVGETDF